MSAKTKSFHLNKPKCLDILPMKREASNQTFSLMQSFCQYRHVSVKRFQFNDIVPSDKKLFLNHVCSSSEEPGLGYLE